MKSMLKIMIVLALIFAATFVAVRATGIVTADSVSAWLNAAGQADARSVIVIVVVLLVADLFVAVPTLTVMLLAGFFLGHGTAFASVMAGITLAASTGYALSRRFGEKLLLRLLRDPAEHQEMVAAFAAHGPILMLLSRAAPMLPEVTWCMAGLTRMPVGRFYIWLLLGTAPYAVIATYAGSVSSMDDPMPAIYAVCGLYLTMWLGFALVRRKLALPSP